MNDSMSTSSAAEPTKTPATYTPVPAKEKEVAEVPTPGKGNDEVMSTPGKPS